MSKTYSISELASEFEVTTRTIRFYEEKGYLKPRREGTRRIYSPSDRTKLRRVRGNFRDEALRCATCGKNLWSGGARGRVAAIEADARLYFEGKRDRDDWR